MRILILLLFYVLPLREVEDVTLALPTMQEEIFANYANDNFSQNLVYSDKQVAVEIISMNFLHLDLNFRVFPDKNFIGKLDQSTREIILALLDNNISFDLYFKNISNFLKAKIEYLEENLPQDAISVLVTRKANCVGYSNLASLLLRAVGVKNRLVKGFYLKKEDRSILTPIPHRWLEIQLADGSRFFYDPQRQMFSADYIVTRQDVNFIRVKKFKIQLVKRSKKIVN